MSLFKLVGEVFVDTSQADSSLSKTESGALKLAKGFTSAGKTIKSAGDKIVGVGKTLTTGVTLPVIGIGAASVNTAANFDKSMSQVQATMGLTKDSMSDLNGESVYTMDALRDLAKEMGETTAWSASECAEALNNLALAGYDTQEIYDTLPNVLSLASAGGLDLATASDMVAGSMAALGIETENSDVIVDQMAKTASSSKTSVEELGDAILTLGATGKDLAGGTTELNTALGILANNSISGSEGGTHLRNIILSLQNPTEKAAKVMKDLGVNVYDANGEMRPLNDILGDLNESMEGMTDEEKSQIISKIFNKTDLSSAKALMENCGDAWDELFGKIEDSAGTAEQMANTQLDNLNGQITLLKSALEGAAITIGEKLMPYIQQLTDFVQGLVDKFNALSPEQQDNIIKFAMFAAAIGPVLIVVGKLIAFIGGIVTAIGTMSAAIQGGATIVGALAAAFGIANIAAVAIIAVIALVIAAGVALYQNWDEVCAWLSDLWTGLGEETSRLWQGFIDWVDRVKENFSEFGSYIGERASETVDNIVGFFTGMWDSISGTFDSISSTAGDTWNSIKKDAGDKWESIKKTVSDAIDNVKGLVNFSWSLPKPKLPKFKVSGGQAPWGFMGQGSLPKVSISWFRKAMNEAFTLDAPTIFGAAGGNLLGAGEAGREVISGEDHLMDLIKEASNGSARESMLEQLIELNVQMLDALRQRGNVYLDRDTLIGELSGGVNENMNTTRMMEARGLV